MNEDQEFDPVDVIPKILLEIEAGTRPATHEVPKKYLDPHRDISDATPIEEIPPIEQSAGSFDHQPTAEELKHYIEYPVRDTVELLNKLGLSTYTSSANQNDLIPKYYRARGVRKPCATIGISWSSDYFKTYPAPQHSAVATQLVREGKAVLRKHRGQKKFRHPPLSKTTLANRGYDSTTLVLLVPLRPGITAGEIRNQMLIIAQRFQPKV